jgi:hypothetical protein
MVHVRTFFVGGTNVFQVGHYFIFAISGCRTTTTSGFLNFSQHNFFFIPRFIPQIAPLLTLPAEQEACSGLSPSQKRLIFRHFSPFFSCVAPAMRLQKRKN